MRTSLFCFVLFVYVHACMQASVSEWVGFIMGFHSCTAAPASILLLYARWSHSEPGHCPCFLFFVFPDASAANAAERWLVCILGRRSFRPVCYCAVGHRATNNTSISFYSFEPFLSFFSVLKFRTDFNPPSHHIFLVVFSHSFSMRSIHHIQFIFIHFILYIYIYILSYIHTCVYIHTQHLFFFIYMYIFSYISIFM